jgi:hypothetical protein
VVPEATSRALAAGDAVEALRFASFAVWMDFESAAAWRGADDCLAATGDDRAARRAFETALRLGPDDELLRSRLEAVGRE